MPHARADAGNFWQQGYTGTVATTTDTFWVNTTTQTTNGINAGVWQLWNNGTAAYFSNGAVRVAVDPGWTPEQRWDQARRALISRNRSRAGLMRRRIAERVADELLLSQLSPEQREEYQRLQRFHVVADGKTYRIRRGWAGNIDLIEDDRVAERWCVHPARTVPVPDNLLAQKLMIESGLADELREIANVSTIRRAA